MNRYILDRTIQAIFTLLAVSLIVFFLVRLSGDPLEVLLSPDASEQDRAILARHLGLDEPLISQYGLFIFQILKGDFGRSIRTGRPVGDMLSERYGATLTLGLASILFSLIVAIPVGVYSAYRRGSGLDLLVRLLAVFGQSMPVFWTGILLIYLFGVLLKWLPLGGSGGLSHYILPAVALGWYISAGIMRLMRSSMLEVLDSEYIKLARIKGVPEWKVIWKHAFKNALPPVITYSAVIFVSALGGTIVVETVFGWPGIGRLIVESVNYRDFPTVQAVVMVLSAMYIGANLIVDILYGYLNPRIRYA